MFSYTKYILLYFSIMILSGYCGTYAHRFPQESLVHDSAAQTTDGDLTVWAPSSASLRLGVCDSEGAIVHILREGRQFNIFLVVCSALHSDQSIWSGERWWNIIFRQVQLRRVLNSLPIWNFIKTCW